MIQGFINESDIGIVSDIFGEELAEKLENSENSGKTFLQILVENGKI